MSQVSVRYIVDDVAAAIDFYTSRLGFTLEMHPAPGFAALSRDGLRLLLNRPGAGGAGQVGATAGAGPSAGGWNRFQVAVDDLAATVASLREEGCVLRGDPVDGMGGRQALVEDPAGNPIELFEPQRRPGATAASAGKSSEAPRADLGPISHRITVDLEPEAAFELFTAGLGDWWPIAYTFSEARFAGAVVEPRVGGHWLERDEDGNNLPWGAVRAFDPGRRLVLAFAIGADRKPVPETSSSEVEVRFTPRPDGRSDVEVEHRDFERHGEGASRLRSGLDSPQGWPLILAELRRAGRRRSS